MKILDTEDRVDHRTRLLPDNVCADCIRAIDIELKEMANDAQTSTLTKYLLGQYPTSEPKNPKIYLAAVAKLFSGYPYAVGLIVVQPGAGLTCRCKYIPTMAELKEALDKELTRLRFQRGNALGHINERARRQKEIAAAEEFERNRPSAEARKAQVAALLKTRNMEGRS